MEDLADIRKLRRKLGLTQFQLAKRANVSQSLIAKVESGKIDPSFTNAKRIFETISMLDKKNELTASDLMYNRIYSIKSSDTLKDAIIRMRRKNISQMPVYKNNKVVGFISESLLLDKLIEGDSSRLTVGEVMEPAPPIMPPNTSQGVIAHLLQHFPFVLIEDKGELVGIVTKADLLKVAYK
jgi:predicted transcriptional regulator